MVSCVDNHSVRINAPIHALTVLIFVIVSCDRSCVYLDNYLTYINMEFYMDPEKIPCSIVNLYSL